MPNLEGLYVKWSGISDLTPIMEAVGLRYFHLGQSANITSIEPLGNMRQLRWLGLEMLSKIRDLSAIGKLVELEGLQLEGSVGTTWKVHTLSPLGSLSALRYLGIANLRSDDMTLSGLFPLARLEAFHHAHWWNDKELDEIRKRNAKLGPT